jgi:hypothetical protein
MGLYGHARIKGKPAPMSALVHVLGRIWIEKSSSSLWYGALTGLRMS